MAQFFKAKKKNTQEKGSSTRLITLKVEQFNHDGQGIGYIDNKICFVDGALPGEEVQAKVIVDKAKLLKAQTVKVLVADENRITPQCSHFDLCGGCGLQYANHDSQLKLKQSALGGLFKRFSNIDSLPWQDSLTAHPWHYRRVARVGVWYDTKSQQFNVGFRQRNSKFITPINECEVLVEAFANLFSAFTELLPQLKVGRSVTHLEVCQADNANVVVIRHTQPLSKADVVKINQLAQVNDYLLVSEYEKGQFTCLSQAVMPTLYYRLPGFSSGGGLDGQGQGLELTFRVDDFIQVNGQINQQMIKQAIDWLALSKSDHVLDLFCGIGNFSLPLATLCATVTGIEGVDGMVRQASHNARHNQLDNCTFLQADLAAPGRLHTGDQTHFNKILLDPARAGAEQVMASIKPFKAQSIVYVSCEPLTLARDSAVLLKSGYQLTKIALMDMFSQTRHVEVMALFEKSPVKTANKPH